MNKKLSLKPLLLSLILFLIFNSLTAQVEPRFPYQREISHANYEKAQRQLQKKLKDQTQNAKLVPFNYAAYRLYSADGFQGRDLQLAYIHLINARNAFNLASPHEAERLTRDGFIPSLFSNELRRIGLLALAQARSIATPDAYNIFLNLYTDIPDSLYTCALYSRDSIELSAASRSGSTQDLQAFLSRRPSSPLLPQAVAMRDSAAFAVAQQAHTLQAYQQFLTDYPNSAQHARATDSIHSIAFRQTLQAPGEQAYRAYASRYPESPYAPVALFRADSIRYHTLINPYDWHSYISYLDSPYATSPQWQTRALHSLAAFALSHNAVEPVAQALVRTSPSDTFYIPLATRLRNIYMLPSVQNYHRLYSSYRKYLPPQWQQHDSIALDAYLNYNFHIADSCIRAIAPYHEAYIILQQLIDHDIRYGRSEQALLTIQPYRSLFTGSDEYARLYETLSNTAAQASRLQQPVFGSLYPEASHPLPSIDGSTLYFSVKGHSSNIGGSDIFSAKNRKPAAQKPAWSNPHIEIDLSHTYSNDAPVSITADGNTLLTLQGNRLYIARRESNTDKWQPAEPLLPKLSLPIADAALTPDGKAVLLSLKTKEDYQTDSSLNLYVILLDTLGAQASRLQLIDLGPVVNTPFNDRAPYLHSDMRTLFFASEGHGSLGQLDLYVVTRLSDTRWDLWSEPRNLGPLVNTVDNDTWIRLAPDGKTAYSHRRNPQLEIITFQLP